MYFQRVKFLFIIALSSILLSSVAQGSKIPEGMTEAHIFPKGHSDLFTSSTKQGLFFFNGRKNELLRVAPRAGTVSSFDGGRWLGFKWIQPGHKGLPAITRLIPAQGSVSTQNPLTIEVNYSDAILGIDAAKVRLFVDSTDVTSRSEISAENILFQLKNPENKTYSARMVVFNNAGFSVEESWIFSLNVLGAISQKEGSVPVNFQLFQNYPNPFKTRQGITIGFQLRRVEPVYIAIYNVRGECVKEWNFAQLPIGKQHFLGDGRNAAGRWLASGIYFLHLWAGNFSARRRIVLLR